MGIDLLLETPVISTGARGGRDGFVRKGVGILTGVVAMIAAQLFMSDLAPALTDGGVDPSVAPMDAFLIIFFAILTVESLLYRLLAHGYKIGGIADRSIGSFLGFVQGVLIVSVVVMMLATQDWPSRQGRRDSRLYRPIANVAPQILDATSGLIPDVNQRLEELTKPPSVVPQRPTGTPPRR